MKRGIFCGLLSAMVSLPLASGSPAAAADLGGNCCADLEERIAELEATTARRGNRKVSLTVSGSVNEALFAWDDGVESNVYVGTNLREQSRVRFVGEARINGDLSTSYSLEFGLFGGDSRNTSQDDPDGTRAGMVSLRRSSWVLKSKSLGKVTLGRDATANYHVLDDANPSNSSTFGDPESFADALAQFRVRRSSDLAQVGTGTVNLRWTDLLQGQFGDVIAQDGLRNVVRYDSPEFAGFSFAASWGEDDLWAASLTYRQTWGDFAVLGKFGYGETADEDVRCGLNKGRESCQAWGVAGSVLHKPTGLFVYGAYAEQHDDNRKAAFGATADDNDAMWYAQGGIERKWLPLGRTTLYGHYRHDDGGSINLNVADTGGFVQSSDVGFWGFGAVQNIEAANLDLYVNYNHVEGNFNDSVAGNVDLETMQMVVAGARLKF